jgi:predicted nicotinamide N-methyase
VGTTAETLAARVARHTQPAHPPLCPELILHLITADMPLFLSSEQDAAAAGVPWPFWGFAWPGGQALARYVLDHPCQVLGRHVLDFGAGCGIAAIAAARAGAARVTASDVDPMAAAATALNARRNGVELEVSTRDLVGRPGEWGVVLVGDMFYDEELAVACAGWLDGLAAAGCRILLGDPGRGFLDAGRLEPLERYQAPADNDADGTRLVWTTVYGWNPPSRGR